VSRRRIDVDRLAGLLLFAAILVATIVVVGALVVRGMR
jgi:hypothetical protein